MSKLLVRDQIEPFKADPRQWMFIDNRSTTLGRSEHGAKFILRGKIV